ncbi:BafA family autotransporter [Bartonella doshiae]|uniref:Adhesin/invasin TibA autotransporter n=4 Tax=Bartonella doshiae TaxID=33044 RepID=A0A380ZEV7_BARDO|nr:BafA family autotransporter [Bartonella doshiae]EJF81888.1 outer membrane autotransporter barrel domain-containing protein [Bartonella doshiae NCTC 12862 = ATCC 700133]MBB6159400.1 outer membrane autotransporter protein [Bartonella doshiae]SUV44685.1 Adhesin/invasin TibA autotransporter precursor [Bartonella doshiae]
MRHKCKFSFSVLMIGNCFIQVASAVEKRNEALIRLEQPDNKKNVLKGTALITTLLSSNITIEDGGVEIVENGKSSVGATVQKGAMQIITRGGIAMNTKISGGKQFVHEESSILDLQIDSQSMRKLSSAYDATVSGSNGIIGQQNVYNGVWVWNTKVGSGGEQNLYAVNKQKGGSAMETVVSGDGRQHVLAGGGAYATTLKDNAIQVVYPRGFVDGLTIQDVAKSFLHVGVEEVVGEVRVNGNGSLYLFAGDVTDHITKEKFSVEGRSDEVLFFVGERDTKHKPQIKIEGLGGEGGNVFFTSIPYDPRHISLSIERLTGSLHFHFNINTMGDYNSDYLLIDDGSGNHTVSVDDSGIELTSPISQKNGLATEINLVTDRSSNGGANFTLANKSGKSIETFDGGTYIYRLCYRDRHADSSGGYTVWYLGMSEKTGCSATPSQRSSKKPKVSTLASFSSNNWNLQSQRESSSSQKQASSRQRSSSAGKNQQDPKKRLPRHLREVPVSALSASSSSENQIMSLSGRTGRYTRSDEHGRIDLSTGTQSLKDEISVHPVRQLRVASQSSHEISVSDFLTTPSTDAILSISVTPGLIFHNELQTARVGRKILDRNKKSSALWSYAIKSKESITTDHIDFKLEQTGVVFGISGLTEFTGGDLYIGGFGSYDQARVAHARGGTSSINIHGIGAYATYFDYNGWYLDSILKYNRYQNSLKAVSTNGLDIEGNYHQWVVGTSFEAGYRFKTWQNGWMQPYGQLTWLQVEGKKIALSNGMIGDIDRSTSLRSEVGVSLGYELGFGMDVSSMAYITAAWVRENRKGNHVTINEQHKFTTDLSGNVGKLGIGLSSFVSDKLKFYAQAHYLQGRKTKQSLQGIVGFRYSF